MTATRQGRHGVTLTEYRAGCRCEPCTLLNRRIKRDYKAGVRAGRLDATGDPRRGGPVAVGPRDDGIVDWVVVDRLLAATIPWDAATRPERIEAARRGFGRDGWWGWTQDVLRLRSDVIAGIAAERRAS